MCIEYVFHICIYIFYIYVYNINVNYFAFKICNEIIINGYFLCIKIF